MFVTEHLHTYIQTPFLSESLPQTQGTFHPIDTWFLCGN